MGITLKGWEQAKSAEVVTRGEYDPFPEGRKIETVVTELSSRVKEGNSPDQVDFMLKLETTDEKQSKGAKYYSCYDYEYTTKSGDVRQHDGLKDTARLLADIKAMGYDLEEGDGVTPEDVMKAVTDDKPIVLVNCVANGDYRNIYLEEFVRYSNDSSSEESTEKETEVQDEQPTEGGFQPE
jgi:hypothetical protein